MPVFNTDHCDYTICWRINENLDFYPNASNLKLVEIYKLGS
jgi:hypothetical protein